MPVIAGAPDLRQIVHRAHLAGLDTLLDYQRLALLSAAVRSCAELDGAFIEFGSYRGGSAAVVASLLQPTGKVLHIVDSFDGLPPPGENDNFHQTGDFNDTSAERVRRGFEALGLSVEMHVGFFESVLSALVTPRLALAHIDVDLYSSVNECLEFCYQRMVPRRNHDLR